MVMSLQIFQDGNNSLLQLANISAILFDDDDIGNLGKISKSWQVSLRRRVNVLDILYVYGAGGMISCWIS